MKICSGSSKTSASASDLCGAIFDVARSRETLASLETKISQPDFWQDQEQAQKVMQQRKAAEAVLASDAKLATIASDIDTYIHLAEEEKDSAQLDSLLKDIEREMTAADAYLSDLETVTLLSGENDRLNAIMTIKPGAGGTESQDWASILLRMYLRWAERKGFNAEVLDETPGEEAGIKNATVQFSGENAYGLLSGETGVHRLVRISPMQSAWRAPDRCLEVVPEHTTHYTLMAEGFDG